MQELILEEKTTLSPVMKEIYRRLRTNLEFTGIENKVICLTSCMENDGKSSVSFNLAKILAENDKRVLFIDADMRNSVLMNRTGIPDDLKGLKIRVQQSPASVNMAKAFGAAASPMSFGEVYTAIQQGVIDGAENNELALTNNKHGEVCKILYIQQTPDGAGYAGWQPEIPEQPVR